MAPVAVEPEVRYTPLILATSHATAVAYFTSLIGIGLYRSYRGLGPSQDTRLRKLWRSKLLPAFGGLAVLSFFLAGYSGFNYATLSYQTWADERGIKVPNNLFRAASQGGNQTASDVHLARWLSDTPVYTDAYEIVVEKARRFWWGQQLDLATVSWSMLLAIEGRRRKIQFLWAYLMLAQTVNLSFAQNLFYVAVLLTPAPVLGSRPSESRSSRLLSGLFPPKPETWNPNAAVVFGHLLVNYGVIFWLPYAAGTTSFTAAVAISKTLTLSLVLLPALLPESWGSVSEYPHDAYDGYTTLFQFMSIANALLFGKSTISAVLYNLPDSYRHRHSIRLPFDTEERSRWERTTSAVGKILGSTSDHPVVAAASRDVLLSALSLGLWAAVRAIDVENMLRSGVPFYEIATAASRAEAAIVDNASDSRVKEESAEPASSTITGRRGQAHKSTSEDTKLEDLSTQAPRRRGRPRKIKSDPEEVPGDGTYEPSPEENAGVVEGDVLPDEGLDWESASLAWGLSSLGGLGAGSVAVFGAECISR